MGRVYETLDETLAGWIGKQRLFFVATAPAALDGHINVSPKGSIETFRILGPTTVAYLDLTGSGIETVAHLRENGRIVVMFCAFEGPPRIVRLHGRGRSVQPNNSAFGELLAAFAPRDDLLRVLRSIVMVDVHRIADSCGYVVPKMNYVEERPQLFRWADARREKDGESWRLKYYRANNLISLDGLAGVELPAESRAADTVGAGRTP